jgi:hypothetical protein
MSAKMFRYRPVFFLFITLILVLALAGSASQAFFRPQTFTVSPDSLDLTVGQSGDVVVSPGVGDPADALDLEWVISEDFVRVAKTPTGATITALKPISNLNIIAKRGAASQTIKITIHPVVQEVRFDSQLFPPGQTDKSIILVQGQKMPIQLRLPNGDSVPASVMLQSENDAVATAETQNNVPVVIAVKPGPPVVINVLSDGVKIDSFKVQVLEAIQDISTRQAQIDLSEKGPRSVIPLNQLNISVTGTENSALDLSRVQFTTLNSNFAMVEGDTLVAKGVGATTLVITPRPLSAAGAIGTIANVRLQIPIVVSPVPSEVTFQPGFVTIQTNRTLDITAVVRDKNGKRLDDVPVTWSLPSPQTNNAETRILFSPQPGNTVTVFGLQGGAEPIRLVATTVDGAADGEVYIIVKDRSVPTGLRPISIRLDLMDDQMARDLYGKKTLDEFYITKIRIFNNLNERGVLTGDSILVFSESMEVGVSLEKKLVKGGKWEKLDDVDIQIIRASLGYGNYNFRRVEATADNPSGQEIVKPAYPVQFPIPYRPYTFEMVANTHDRRDERSLRSRILLGMNILGSGTSFVTSFLVPKPGSDLPLGLDKYRNIFIPGFERFFPSLREVQRQNIVSQVMKPLEEVPNGSDITRVLFFPKREMSGVLPNYKVRINGISTYELQIQVATIKKTPVEQQ